MATLAAFSDTLITPTGGRPFGAARPGSNAAGNRGNPAGRIGRGGRPHLQATGILVPLLRSTGVPGPPTARQAGGWYGSVFVLCPLSVWCNRAFSSLPQLSIELQYTTVHYTTLQYTTVHYTTVHYTTLHYTTVHYSTLHKTTFHPSINALRSLSQSLAGMA